MKSMQEISGTINLQIMTTGTDGGAGWIFKAGKRWASVIWSTGGGWDHVSVSPMNIKQMPSWEDMCRVKDMFFKPEEYCVQYHVPAEDNINVMSNCLHIWRPQNQVLPVPPKNLV